MAITWFHLFCFLFSTISAFLPQSNSLLCLQTEKTALVIFKHALSDPGNRLSSWSDIHDEDCCRWNGVYCHNITGRVIQLRLRNPCVLDSGETSCEVHNFSLGGKVSPALLQLELLNYMDLSYNDFGGTPIPSFLGSMRSLTHLDLCDASFGGLIPPQLGNLSNLGYLCLDGGYVDNLGWISHISSLEHLFMDGVDLHGEVHWLESISMLSSLSELVLSECGLDNMSPSLGYVNFTSLRVLSLPWNNIHHEIPNWIFNLSTSLFGLHLHGNMLTGQIPEHIGQLRHLKYILLSENFLDGSIPSSLGNLSSLIELYLYENKLNGTLPSSLWLLSNLEILFIQSNFLSDTISEVHFNKLSKLKVLEMSSTSLNFKINSNWVPPFQLEYLGMSACQMGPNFPTWLQTQTSLTCLSISNSGIMDIAPAWFWKWATHIDEMDLSNNKISGNLSGVLLESRYIDLSCNCFVGELPLLSPRVVVLKIANNSFSGPISHFLCQMSNGKSDLRILDLSINSLSGELSPNCSIMYWQSLTHLNLGNNKLFGEIPDSIGSLYELEALHLNDNGFYGDIPPSLRNCTSLGLLDLGGNKFSGSIPSWMGGMMTLTALRLRSNRLVGDIPPQICWLSSLIILDLANNSLSGTIPKCFNNFSLMAVTAIGDDDFSALTYEWFMQNYENLMLVMKGKDSEYKTILMLVRAIDLSTNALWGSIPTEISNLSGLQSLNLSFNHLTGSMPEKMGNMKALESLDLSRNHLSGEIPHSMSSLTFLSHLDLSYNNFSGKIPSSTQLQTFDAVSYIGNAELCGPPLPKNCTEDEDQSQGMFPFIEKKEEEEEDHEMPWFYFGMSFGFITGFLGVCCALIFKKAWRYSYFQFLYNVKEWVHMTIAVRWNRLQNRLKGNADD